MPQNGIGFAGAPVLELGCLPLFCYTAWRSGGGWAMDISVEALWQMPEAELLAAYHGARRLYAEKKFARDTERGRLQWQRARMFATGTGGVTERLNAVEASEELAKKGQHVRELTRELDLAKSDVGVIYACLRLRGVAAFSQPKNDDFAQDDSGPEADEAGPPDGAA